MTANKVLEYLYFTADKLDWDWTSVLHRCAEAIGPGRFPIRPTHKLCWVRLGVSMLGVAVWRAWGCGTDAWHLPDRLLHKAGETAADRAGCVGEKAREGSNLVPLWYQGECH